MTEVWLWSMSVLTLANGLLLIWLVRRAVGGRADSELLQRHQTVLRSIDAQQANAERMERALRHELGESSRQLRQEMGQTLSMFQQTWVAQSAEATRTQNSQIDAFGQQLALLQKSLSDTLHTQLSGLSETNARRMAEVRQTLEAQLAQLQTSNSAKLEEMRATVDEKLQSTLQARLGESFKQVAERLEQVHKGLGEMQTLAQGVGDLKHLLSNVKTRGMFGEA
ncbi:MAG: hypothetical protein RJA34_2689, partial [Pseudomonadota bacterium]